MRWKEYKINKKKLFTGTYRCNSTPDIKVITGVRRSGKSKLLEMFKKYIEERYINGKKNFVLIDEVQMCAEFERTINSLHAEEKYVIK